MGGSNRGDNAGSVLSDNQQVKDAAHPCSIELLEGQCIGLIKAFMEHRQRDIAASTRSRSDMGFRAPYVSFPCKGKTRHVVLTLKPS